MLESREAIRQAKALLAKGSIREAVIVLNGQTEHRFTALYRFDADLLHNLVLYDREDPQQLSTPDIPIMASYCVFIRDRGEAFSVSDSQADERVAGHPKRQAIRSYCGVPLLDDSGEMFGTICHFDFRPLGISDEAVAAMESIASTLQRGVRHLA